MVDSLIFQIFLPIFSISQRDPDEYLIFTTPDSKVLSTYSNFGLRQIESALTTSQPIRSSVTGAHDFLSEMIT